MSKKVSYTCREKEEIQKMKSILTFQKWTKKMSKIDPSKTFLLRKKFVLIKKNYRHKLNESIFYSEHNFFIFFAKKYLGTFCVDNIYQHVDEFKFQKFR